MTIILKEFRMLRDILYTGLGAASLMHERVESELKTLEEKGKIKREDAKSFMDSIKERGREEDSKSKEKIKEMLKEVIDELGLATKEDIEALKREKS